MKSSILVVAIVLAALLAGGPEARSAKPAGEEGMVYVPGGTFIMGRELAEGDPPTEDSPAHPVELKPFWVDRYESTNGQYAAFIEAKGYEKEEFWSPAGWEWLQERERRLPVDWEELRSDLGEDFGRHPVAGITWFEADAFARFSGKRLLTEAEWERAARGTDARLYPWGNKVSLGLCEEVLSATRPVGTNPPDVSPAGCFDMGGNVSEWTSGWFEPYPGTKFESRLWREGAKPCKVARGGSWRTRAAGERFATEWFRASYRLVHFRHQLGHPFIGVRLAKDAN